VAAHKVIAVGGPAPRGAARVRSYGPVEPGQPAVHCAWFSEQPDLAGLGCPAWLVEERPKWDELDQPGITRFSFLHRAAGIDHDEFARHWTEVHAPLARRHHPALRRYVQNIVIQPTGDADPIDGIVELGFASVDDLEQRMYDSDEGRAAVAADVRTFIDVGAGWRVVTRDPD
jgi:uncharacterized protein (TIGR02118 family)